MRKTIIFLILLVLTGYSLYLVAVPHYNHFAFKSDLEELLGITISHDPKRFTKDIMNLAEEYNIPIKEDDLYVTWENGFTVKTDWEETVNFFSLYQKTFKFRIDTRKLR
ncbi:MAG: hypothetical protein L0956_08520 [Candidatus Mariimomonas ferrooxydans]